MSSPSPGSSTPDVEPPELEEEPRPYPLWVRLIGTLAVIGVVAGAWLVLRDHGPADPPAPPPPPVAAAPQLGPTREAQRAVRTTADEFLENFRRWTWGRRIPLSRLQPATAAVQQGLAGPDPDWRAKRRRALPRMLVGKPVWAGSSQATVPFRADPDPLGGWLQITQDLDDTWRVSDMTLETIPEG